jgi:hypothetical protein
MIRLPSPFTVLAVAAALAAAVWHGCDERRSRRAAEEARAQWEREAEMALSYARLESARADSAAARADSLGAVVREALERAALDSARAARLAARIGATPVPAPCEPYTAPRDTLGEHLGREAAALREALAASESAAERLTVAYALEAARGDSLAAVLLRPPEPEPGWRLLGIRVPPAVETGMRCALPGGVAWATTDELAVGVLVAAACMAAHGW